MLEAGIEILGVCIVKRALQENLWVKMRRNSSPGVKIYNLN